MSHTISFQVQIVVADKITDDKEIDQMSQKIANAICNECRKGDGITPEDSETFTEIIYVKGWYSDKTIIEHP